MIIEKEVRHWHAWAGIGGGARGFNKGTARVGNLVARFRCLGGVDIDPAACRDFEARVGVPCTRLDLMDRYQYIAFHGHEPPADWRPATIDDIRRSAGNERPHIVFASAPCKGFSGLLPEATSKGDKYQALNSMLLHGMDLILEAWADDPVELIILENVPRIASRGRVLLDRLNALLQAHGYAARETVHDCGVIGGLGQSRKRFLLVARHMVKVPPFLYEPPKRALRGVGEIIGKFPVPGPDLVLPMHRCPSLQWKTWVRLAFVEAGADWRSLNRLIVEDGLLRDFAIMPGDWQGGVLGVRRWDEPSGVVAGRSTPTNGAFSVADPRPLDATDRPCYGVGGWQEPAATITSQRSPGQGRFSVADPRIDGHDKSVQLGVRPWDQPAGVVTGKMFVGGGPHAVADPRMVGKPRFNNTYRIVPWGAASPAVAGPGGPAGGLSVADPRPSPREDYKQTKYRVTGYDEPAGTVIGASSTGNGGYAVADPRTGFGPDSHRNKLKVVGYDDPAGTVTGADRVGSGALSVADPRPAGLNASREHYVTGGHYGVVPWERPTGAVPAYAKHDRGPWSVADPRPAGGESGDALPRPTDRLVAVIEARDGTWHRPFTTLELAALQSLVDPDRIVGLDGNSDTAHRERIGNAVPEDAAAAVAGVMGKTLLLAWSGTTFMLSNEPVWVQPVLAALSVKGVEEGWRP
jgi:site-specific DNA-cytosine methylase